jgi:hypothetical protein
MGDVLIGIAIGIGLGAVAALVRAGWLGVRRGARAPARPPTASAPDASAAQPPPELDSAASPGPTLAGMILHPAGTADERSALASKWHSLERRTSEDPWLSIERALQHDMEAPEFWSRPDRFDVLSRGALIDRVRAAIETARGLDSRLDRSEKPDGRCSRDVVSQLALQLLMIGHGIADVVENAPVEMVISVQPTLDAAHDAPAGERWCERLFEMYRRWAARRHMQWEAVPGPPGTPRLAVVAGFGAARVLLREVGLHTLDDDAGREGRARVVARVRAAPTPAVMPESPTAKHTALVAELQRQTAMLPVVRRYRLEGSPLISDVTYGWRTGRPELVLGGDFDLLGEGLAAIS